jgi:site-specific DNA-cytosine methylase
MMLEDWFSLPLGFHNAGFDITAAYDINHSGISVYNQNIKSKYCISNVHYSSE